MSPSMDSPRVDDPAMETPLKKHLDALPLEIQHSIFRLLDPAGLIAVSQTSRFWRRIINPQRQHFIERLLAWECLPEYGGPPCNVSMARNSPIPDWDTDGWNHARFACGGCLALRRHTDFSYKYIARLRFKKPQPESPPSLLLTSWEPSNHKQWGRKHWKQKKEQGNLAPREWKRRLGWALGGYRRGKVFVVVDGIRRRASENLDTHLRYGCESFRNISDAEWACISDETEDALMEREVAKIEYAHSGSDRHLRRCHTYRLGAKGCIRNDISGYYKNNNSCPETQGRTVSFESPLERWFPGLFSNTGLPRPPIDRNDLPWRMTGSFHRQNLIYRMCRTCGTWKEERSFPLGYIDDHACYHCIASEPRGRDKLGTLLQMRLITCCEGPMQHLQFRLEHNAPRRLLSGDWPATTREDAPKGPLEPPDRTLIWDFKTLAEFEKRYKYCLELFKEGHLKLTPDSRRVGQHASLMFSCWIWLGKTLAMLRDDPEPLLEWALARHGAELGETA
ncbi:uncharacterized protein F5Z01DRAFT_675750 [Emericellopsis atlantica]|uniref:F-box domain-containing protein n=1 Tax=Emericellopsis atlantica TaxID=2614577 RepID=A0A9P8CPC6_9HYPO|nr:uncharacterized protein F5Z01DRAFT_675750 [Emericellopsis atlantica]KAG9252631.1 hypothetical protein F5Z01DRAFT_675750 [Emericellopsis atlantica]